MTRWEHMTAAMQVADLKALGMEGWAVSAVHDGIVFLTREFVEPPAGPLTLVEQQRLAALRAQATRTPAENTEMEALAARSPDAARAAGPLTPPEQQRLVTLRASMTRTPAENSEMDALAARSVTPPAVMPFATPLTPAEQQRLTTLRASTSRTPAEDAEMAELAARS